MIFCERERKVEDQVSVAIATSQKEKPHVKVGENVFEILDEKPQYDVAINDCLVVFSKHYAERERERGVAFVTCSQC